MHTARVFALLTTLALSSFLAACGSTTVTLREEPHRPGFLGSAPFDDDGVATRAKTVVDAGRLASYLLGVYSARRLDRVPTGNSGGVHNLEASTGARTLEQIVADCPRALLVTDLMGFGVNGVTGDYSRGASGFLIENGAIAHAVEEITIAGNLRDMYRGIVAVGDDVDRRSQMLCGSILIEDRKRCV